MTVGYLKEQLENYPDEARIILDGRPLSKIDIKASEVIDMFSVTSPDYLKNYVILQTRDDFDFIEELQAKIKYLRNKKKAENWKEILINQGFSEDEIVYALRCRPIKDLKGRAENVSE